MVRSNLLEPRASVVIPTLTAGDKLARCLDCLEKQTFEAFDIYIVDNSGEGLAEPLAVSPRITLIRNSENVGFGAAVNQAVARSSAEFICTLNDDAYPSPEWLAELVNTCVGASDVGLCASRIYLGSGRDRLDSEGLAVYGDGTTKQSRHGRPPIEETAPREVLLPSGCAALYRRSLLRALDGFDEDYFLYCEDSDLGLRARQAGWRCLYSPRAVVEHDYSASAGRASALKAYLVERNRLYTVVKVFPLGSGPSSRGIPRGVISPMLALSGNSAAWRQNWPPREKVVATCVNSSVSPRQRLAARPGALAKEAGGGAFGCSRRVGVPAIA